MTILLDRKTAVLVQGITGKIGSFHAKPQLFSFFLLGRAHAVTGDKVVQFARDPGENPPTMSLYYVFDFVSLIVLKCTRNHKRFTIKDVTHSF